MPPSPASNAYRGAQDPASGTSPLNAQAFLISQMINKMWTAIPVKVLAVHGGGLAGPPTVDVLPLVNQIDGAGQVTPHGTIYGMPAFRLQAAAGAIVIDPVAGDIGTALFAHSDISAVKSAKKASPPGSRRKFDPADGMYFGGFLNDVVSTYLLISSGVITLNAPSDINITSATKVTVTAPEVDVISNNVNLGATGGKKVVLDGDPVVGGAVVASSTKVKAK